MSTRSIAIAVAMGLSVTFAGCSQPGTSSGMVRGAGEPWTQQEILDHIAPLGFTEMPAEQQIAVADGIVTWAEYEQAKGRVEECYEQEFPGHELTFSKYEFDPESGQPPQLTARISHGAGIDEAKLDAAMLDCEEQYSLPLEFLYQEMHIDRAKAEQWEARQPSPGPDAVEVPLEDTTSVEIPGR